MPKAEYHIYIDQVRDMIENQKLTQKQIGEILGKDRTTIERWCRRYGLKTQRTGPRNGDKHFCWKGGKKIVKGYLYIYSPDHPNKTKDGYVSEHRLEMEKHLGRYLERNEVVHHIDGNTLNNMINNLQNADHLRHELTGKTPNWSQDGIDRINAGIRKAAAIHRHIKSDDDLRILSTDHQP